MCTDCCQKELNINDQTDEYLNNCISSCNDKMTEYKKYNNQTNDFKYLDIKSFEPKQGIKLNLNKFEDKIESEIKNTIDTKKQEVNNSKSIMKLDIDENKLINNIQNKNMNMND